MLFQFIQRILVINRNGKNMADGISIMNLIISMLENLVGQIDAELPSLLEIVVGELEFAEQN